MDNSNIGLLKVMLGNIVFASYNYTVLEVINFVDLCDHVYDSKVTEKTGTSCYTGTHFSKVYID